MQNLESPKMAKAVKKGKKPTKKGGKLVKGKGKGVKGGKLVKKGKGKFVYEPFSAKQSLNNALRTCVCSASTTLPMECQKNCKKVRREMENLIKDQQLIVDKSMEELMRMKGQQGTVRVPKCICDKPVGERKVSEKICRRKRWLELLGVPFEREGVKNPATLDMRIAKIHFPMEAFADGGKGLSQLKNEDNEPSTDFSRLEGRFTNEERRIKRTAREVNLKREDQDMQFKQLKSYDAFRLADAVESVHQAAVKIGNQIWEYEDSNPLLDDDELEKYHELKDDIAALEKERMDALNQFNDQIADKISQLGNLLKPTGRKRYIADALGRNPAMKRKKPELGEEEKEELRKVFLSNVNDLNKGLEKVGGAFEEFGLYWLPDSLDSLHPEPEVGLQ